MSRLDVRRLGLAALIGGGLVAVVVGFASGQDTHQVQGLPDGIEQVTPSPGAQIERQTEVIADLSPGFTGVLQIDRVEPPLDQLTVDDAQNLVIFPCRLAPGTTGGAGGPAVAPTKCVRPDNPFPPGTHQVTVVYWKQSEGRDAGARYYSWTFKTY